MKLKAISKTIIFLKFILFGQICFNYGQIITSPANNSVIQFEEGQSLNVTFKFTNVFRCDNPEGVFALVLIDKIPDGLGYYTGILMIGKGMSYNGGQFSSDLIPGTYDVGVILNHFCGYDSDPQTPDHWIRITVEKRNRITFANNFGTGTLKVNGGDVSSGFQDVYISGTSLSLEANEPQYSSNPNYEWVWNDTEGTDNKSNWIRRKSSGLEDPLNENQNYSFTVDYNDHLSTYIANMRKICYATFQSAGGTVYLDGTHSSPYTVQVVEQNRVTATADYYDQGLYYRFKGWNGSNSSTVTPYETSTYTASFTREPSLLGMDFTLVSGIGSNPTLTWNEHQHPDVTKYRIYRTIKNVETDVLIAELNRGTTTYTDYSRIITNNDATNNLTFYRLRVVLTPENLESEEWGQTCYTTVDMKLAGNDNNITMVKTEVPEDFSISSYPNPFNPTTTINYQLPENSYVTIKVYDILGKEIAALVNESKSAGFHNVSFDASRLTSGIYIYIINAGKYTQSKKMLLMK